ncbi:hypothetical protein [Paenibacillus solani]|uniref:Uncharacterized protein n=1 Tax=Paenibacillus solani TaxID=1705565 RepID=A0A0M1P3D9_9BACL|nr:hypothetical protein [Paenibacillus solani]KOR88902.1 hypothetical protein AM231_06805 [Paenibacillus solani]
MSQSRIKHFLLPFLLEWRQLWRSDLGSPGWSRWRNWIYALYIVVLLAVATYRLLTSSYVPDARGVLSLGFITTLFLWSSFKSISFIQNHSNVFIISMAPYSKYLHLLLKISAHWLYHSALFLLLLSPTLLNMIFGGHPQIVVSYALLWIVALWTISLSWILMSLIVYQWGADVARFFLKIMSFFLSIGATAEIVFYPHEIEQIFQSWMNELQSLLPSLGFFLGSGVVLLMAVWTASGLLTRRKASLKNNGGGAAEMKMMGFSALLMKEYRLLLRLIRKIALFTLFNYALSFGIVWVLFRMVHPNELYFYVSLMMFIFAVYIAGPSNMLSACEEQAVKILRTSPTSIKRVIMAKTIAVYSILGPVSLVAGGIILRINQKDPIQLYLIIGAGICIGIVSVWTGAIETFIHLFGFGFPKMMAISMPSLVGSALLVITTYFMGGMNTVAIALLLLCVLAIYSYSILTGLRLLRRA